MKKTIFLITILVFIGSSLAFAKEINVKYSFKDFTHIDLSDTDAKDWNNTIVKGSCFYQESAYSASALSASPPNPMKSIFPVGMTGVEFIRCNLDNVIVPPGNTIGGRNSHRKIRVQNDNEDWILGADNKPVEPIDIERMIEEGKSIDPKDISEVSL